MRTAAVVFFFLAGCSAAKTASIASVQPAPPLSNHNVAHYHGCPVFTAGDWFNAPVRSASADPHSKNYIDSMYANGDNGGFVTYNVDPIAYHVNLATKLTPKRRVSSVTWHQDEFPDPVPWQADFLIQELSDRHAIVVSTDTCTLTEFYHTDFSGDTLFAYSGWTWNLRAPLSSPRGNQPSSTASGLPIFPGILKGEEIESAAPINHALDFAPPMGSISPGAFVAPATSTGGCGGCSGPPNWPAPYGAHLRLHEEFQLNCGGGCPQAQRIVQALKDYGAFISDTGSKGTGNQLWVAADASDKNPWDASDLANLDQIHITDMDVLKLGPRQYKQ